MEQPKIEQFYKVPQPVFFMYASRAGVNPNEFLTKLQLTHDSMDTKLGGYMLSRKQHMAMLYLAGLKKSEQELTENEEDLLHKIDTSTLIQELERRTRS
jgi:type II secretory pathway component PulC